MNMKHPAGVWALVHADHAMGPSSSQYEMSAHADGWFDWFGVWLHIYPLQSGYERPSYFIGTSRDLCLSQGLFTGESVC